MENVIYTLYMLLLEHSFDLVFPLTWLGVLVSVIIATAVYFAFAVVLLFAVSIACPYACYQGVAFF